MDLLEKIDMFLIHEKGEKWSGDIKTKWSPPEGTFTKSSKEIASVLAKASSDLKQAMGRLNFYLNRAGKNLSDKDRKRIEAAKPLLRKAFA